MARITVPFYIQDFWQSRTYKKLRNGVEVWIYLECLFTMYHEDGFMSSSYQEFAEARYPKPVPVEAWEFVTSFFLFTPDRLEMISKTVFDRLEILILQAFTGSLAGKTEAQKKRLRFEHEKGVEKRYKKYAEATLRGDPQRPPSKPTLGGTPESQQEEQFNTSHSVGECEGKDNGHADKPKTLPPLRAAGFLDGKPLPEIWREYGGRAERLTNDEKTTLPRLIEAFGFFWPGAISGADWKTINNRLNRAGKETAASVVFTLAGWLNISAVDMVKDAKKFVEDEIKIYQQNEKDFEDENDPDQ
jgi:hypothetical protein